MNTDFTIQLRTSRTDHVSATNPRIGQFVAIRGSRGRCGIGSLSYSVAKWSRSYSDCVSRVLKWLKQSQ